MGDGELKSTDPFLNLTPLLLRAGFFCLLLAGLAGCSSLGKPASASFASVVITNTTPADIRATTIQVFQEAEYQGAYIGPDTLVFEREGTKGESLAYNGLVGTHYGQTTLNRVRAKIVDRGEGTYRLSCQAYIIPNADAISGGHEIKLTNARSGPYQKLLDEVAARLNKHLPSKSGRARPLRPFASQASVIRPLPSVLWILLDPIRTSDQLIWACRIRKRPNLNRFIAVNCLRRLRATIPSFTKSPNPISFSKMMERSIIQNSTLKIQNWRVSL
jgi:hypothetical protein